MQTQSATRWTRWWQARRSARPGLRPWLAYTLSLLLAVAGYGALLLFPVLTVWLLLSLPGQFLQASSITDYVLAGLTTIAAPLAGLFSLQLLRLRPAPPPGPILDPGLTPALHEQINELASRLGAPVPERVCLSDGFVLRILPAPRYGLPWGMGTTLQLGLPLLECLSPAQLDILLARSLGQHGGRGAGLAARVTAWLTGLRQLWPYYRYHGAPAWPLRPLQQGFFAGFAPLYARLSQPLAQRSELDADRYALDIYNDHDVLEALVAEHLARHFLNERFWPAFLAQADRQDFPPGYPHAAMGKSLRREPRERLQHWLDNAMSTSTSTSAHATLAQRLEGIGHLRAWLPRLGETSAATDYLGAALPELRRRVGRDWLGKALPAWRERHTRRQREWEMLKALQARARHTPLSAEEAWRCARLADRHLGRRHALPLFRAIVERHPEQARLQYAVGRVLLEEGDPVGLKALQHAMQHDPALKGPITQLLARRRGTASAATPGSIPASIAASPQVTPAASPDTGLGIHAA